MQYVSPCIVTISAPFSLTDCQRFFEQPATARQRQYEAFRAYFLEEVPSAEAARSFGYSPCAFRVLCHAFRHGQLPEFFSTRKALRPCRGGSTRSAPSESAAVRRPSPMSATSCCPRVSSPTGSAACS